MGLKSPSQYWEGELDVDAVTLPEGESGGGPRERLTAERLDRIATYFAAPEEVRRSWGGPKDVAELARDVGCRVKSVHLWQRNQKMLDRVRDLTEMAAVYAMPNILYGQVILATPCIERNEDGSFTIRGADSKASNFVATVAKYIRQGAGATMTQVNMAPNNEKETGMSDQEFESRLDRAMKTYGKPDGDDDD